MSARSSREHWGRVARFLHWGMAVLILAQLALGWLASDMARSPEKIQWMTGHKSLGITILLLAVFRIAWRVLHGRPAKPPGLPRWTRLAARLSHVALYVVMLALPLSGWLVASASRLPWKLWWWLEWPRLAGPDPALKERAEALHEAGAWLLAGLLAIHVGAALWHHFARRDQVLERMWSGA